jgi:hypothetical protein
MASLKLPMIKLRYQSTNKSQGIKNHTHRNLSLLSSGKTPIKLPNAIGSISPVSIQRAGKRRRQYSYKSIKFQHNPKFKSKGMLLPSTKSPYK